MPRVRHSTLVAAVVGALVVVAVEGWVFLAASGPGTCGEESSGVCFPVMQADPPWWLLLIGGLLGACVGAMTVWAFRLLRRFSLRRRLRPTGRPLG